MKRARIAGRRSSLRPAGSADIDRLVAWHADPEIARFWDGEVFTRDEMERRLERPHVEPWIIESDGVPVGYLQVSEGGIDLFLVPGARGRAIGTDAVRTMAVHLLEHRGLPRVTVDTYTWNTQAIRAFQKAGFVVVARCASDDDHKGEWLMMEYQDTRPLPL